MQEGGGGTFIGDDHDDTNKRFDLWTLRRHYMDVVLVAVVALCTVENDVIHAAYLAIALLLFRRRDTLRHRGNTLFRWLPAYNFAVMLLTLAYQAPWPAIFVNKHQPSFTQVSPPPPKTHTLPFESDSFQKLSWAELQGTVGFCTIENAII